MFVVISQWEDLVKIYRSFKVAQTIQIHIKSHIYHEQCIKQL